MGKACRANSNSYRCSNAIEILSMMLFCHDPTRKYRFLVVEDLLIQNRQSHHDRATSSRYEPDYNEYIFGDPGGGLEGNDEPKVSISVEEPVCSICLLPFSDANTWLSCAHQFHTGCIDEWQKTCNQSESVTCPICRNTTRLEE
jgi:hypothetical protein